MSDKWKVVYLTGAPAAGKSTLTRMLASTRPDVKVFEYGRMMSEMLSCRKAPEQRISQHMLRGGTSGRVTQRDIDDLDAEMTGWIERYNSQYHLVIDSHQVTIEPFGFRISPFADARLSARRSIIWLLVLDTVSTLDASNMPPTGVPYRRRFKRSSHPRAGSSSGSLFGYDGSPRLRFRCIYAKPRLTTVGSRTA